jgi:hypothetical protein
MGNTMRSTVFRAAIATLLACAFSSCFADSTATHRAHASNTRPVDAIASARMPVDTPQGHADFALDLSANWNTPQPGIVRAVIVLHGRLRNADDYFRTAQRARAAAGGDPASTLLIAPQFLSTDDTHAFHSPPDLLSWHVDAWMGGADAKTGVPIGAYAVLDVIAHRLADKQRFPNLKTVVFAGHSGGAQVLQRYALASDVPDELAQAGIDVRFVVASPSSYAYFDAQRPVAFDAASCPGFDQWKYGMQARPAFLRARTPEQLEARYAQRHILYLVGGDDHDPQSASLDKSCAAMAQGPQRLARAEGFFSYMQSRHPRDLNQQFHVVPGVGHNEARMLTSHCALNMMFDVGSCDD